MDRFLASAITAVCPLSLGERDGVRGYGLSGKRSPSPGFPKAMLGMALGNPTSPHRGEARSRSWQRLTSSEKDLLLRCHAQRGVEPHHFAVQIRVVDHVQRQRGKFVGMAEPMRERERGGERVLGL